MELAVRIFRAICVILGTVDAAVYFESSRRNRDDKQKFWTDFGLGFMWIAAAAYFLVQLSMM